MTIESWIERCHLCLGRGRWRNKRCPVCGGSGKVWKPEEPPQVEAPPTEMDEVVYVVSACCDECGDRTLLDPSKPHKASTFRDNPRIFCGKCNRGLMTFVLAADQPGAVEGEE